MLPGLFVLIAHALLENGLALYPFASNQYSNARLPKNHDNANMAGELLSVYPKGYGAGPFFRYGTDD